LRVEWLEVCAHAHHPKRGEAKAHSHPVVLLLAHHALEVGQEAAAPVLGSVRPTKIESAYEYTISIVVMIGLLGSAVFSMHTLRSVRKEAAAPVLGSVGPKETE